MGLCDTTSFFEIRRLVKTGEYIESQEALSSHSLSQNKIYFKKLKLFPGIKTITKE